MSWQDAYLDRYYRRKEDWVDGTTQFYALCRRYITNHSKVLEVGAGPSNETSRFLSETAASVVGLDVDEAVKGNKYLAEARVYDGTSFPFGDASFDCVVSDYVLEHVEDATAVCREINRVLAPGGMFLFRTPSVFHYVSVFSRFLPDSVSRWARRRGDEAPDTYPKFYRFNSVRTCRRIFSQTGLDIVELDLVEKEPSYGMRSRLIFLTMVAYERLVNASALLGPFRANIFCAARKSG